MKAQVPTAVAPFIWCNGNEVRDEKGNNAVVALAGRRIDLPGAQVPRFPLKNVQEVGRRVCEALCKMHARHETWCGRLSCHDSRSDPDDVAKYFGDIFDVKRFAFSNVTGIRDYPEFTHDATTLGGNSCFRS